MLWMIALVPFVFAANPSPHIHEREELISWEAKSLDLNTLAPQDWVTALKESFKKDDLISNYELLLERFTQEEANALIQDLSSRKPKLAAVDFSVAVLKQLARKRTQRLEISVADQLKIEGAWAIDKAFIWSGIEGQKDPLVLEPVLRAAFTEAPQTTEVHYEVLRLDQPWTDPEFKLKRLYSLRAGFSEYQREKYKRSKDESLIQEAEAFYESISIAQFVNEQGESCYLPSIGQSFQSIHEILLGFEPNSTKPWLQELSNDGIPLNQEAVEIESGSRRIRLRSFRPVQEICKWGAEANIELHRWARNYSIFQFYGVDLVAMHPSEKEKMSLSLVIQTPSVRRGLDRDCALPEEKTWSFINKSGGRAFLSNEALSGEASKNSSALKLIPHAGARLIREGALSTSEVMQFELFLWSRPSQVKTLELRTSWFELKSWQTDFTKWLAHQIPQDPY